MDRRINLGISMTPEQEFDSRLGSEIFAVSFTDVTIKVELGGSGKDDSLSDEVKEKLVESIYILKYTASSWTNVNNALNNDNEKLRRELIESNEFIQFVRENPNEIEKETHLLSLVSKVLGNDYLSKHNSMG